MVKGSMVGQFRVDEVVEFLTTEKHGDYKKGTESSSSWWERGTIVKLHKSGQQGVAEIRTTERGSGKVARSLRHVRKAS